MAEVAVAEVGDIRLMCPGARRLRAGRKQSYSCWSQDKVLGGLDTLQPHSCWGMAPPVPQLPNLMYHGGRGEASEIQVDLEPVLTLGLRILALVISSPQVRSGSFRTL